jgi:peptidoglycan/LPS O-acetylase OafA/YrhL
VEISSVKSSLFDFVRWVSAFLVVAGHIPMVLIYFWPNPGLSDALIFLSEHAHAAVILFFVLSGYLIAYSDFNKYKNDRNYNVTSYLTNRFVRIYSVLVPAILLTLILDGLGRIWLTGYLNPSIFPQDHYVIRLIINLISMQGIWGNRVQLGSNPALWSIGYEFTFYVLYGLFVWKREKVFMNKWSMSILILIFLVRGPQVMYYFLLWLLGVLSFRLSNVYRMILPYTWSIFIFLALGIGGYYIQYINILGLNEMSRDFVWALLLALLFFPDYSSGGVWLNWKPIKIFNKVLADSSYSLYAYHLPFLYFIIAYIAAKHSYLLQHAQVWIYFLFPLTYLFCYLMYRITEDKRQLLKQWIFAKILKL